MPKTSNEGPTYAGLVDVSPPETATPEWVEAGSDADVSRETKAEDKPAKDDEKDTAEHGRRPSPKQGGRK